MNKRFEDQTEFRGHEHVTGRVAAPRWNAERTSPHTRTGPLSSGLNQLADNFYAAVDWGRDHSLLVTSFLTLGVGIWLGIKIGERAH